MFRIIILIFLIFTVSCEKREEINIAVFISGDGRLEKVGGFIKGLKDLGIKNIKIDLYKGNNSLKSLEDLAQNLNLKTKRYRLIAAGGSLEAYILKKHGVNEKIPVVILGGTSILSWGLTDSFSRPSENITGVNNLNAELMEKRIELFTYMFPDVRKVIIFCSPKFEASRKAARITIKTAKKFNLKVVPLYVKDVKELEFVMSHMKEDGYGAVIMTPCYYTENFLTHYILHYANFYKVPVFCHSPEFAKEGCPVAYGTPAFEQGYTAAHVAYKILKGIPVENVPFVRAYSPKFILNLSALKELYVQYNERILVYADEVVK
ncbi:ABC transporter substrate-binding protein [Aquifex aeolicus]|uniref:ABC transporter substrate-binding protein n=1 Tax=Aquifex aeolicus (strain VF5) TaxID=224324 RepID=O67196_AQUAE|nr:ABC transporter substrate-binding protein [Aquifex aeolicus]AAC07162.1 putative protein [Aquifex aeolicus VF5]